jgi:hypothetical protein
MNHASIVSGMLLAFVTQGALAQEEKKPAADASVQGAGQGQADVQADQSGAAATGKAAGTAGAQAGESSAALAQGTEINATLTRPVDAGKARPGDEVTAKASQDIQSGGTVVVPRGSRLFGHVTSARPRGSGTASGGSASELGILFDRAVLKDGSIVTLNGAVAAIGTTRAAGGSSPDSGAAGEGSTMGSAGGAGGGLTGAVGGTVGGVAGATTGVAGNVGATAGGAAGTMVRSVGAVGGFDAAGDLKSGSRGVFGVRDLNIAAAASGGAGGSVITSAQRNVRLESGTQMLLVAGANAGKQPAADPEAPRERPDADKR